MIQNLFYHYFMLNLLLFVASIVMLILSKTVSISIISFKQQLKISRFLLLYTPCIYLLIFFLKSYYFPEQKFIFQLPVIATPIIHNIAGNTLQIGQMNQFSLSDYCYILIFLSILSVVISKTVQLVLQLTKLNSIVSNGIFVKRYHNIDIIVSDAIRIPFCFSYLKRSHIVLSRSTLENFQYYKLSIQHELQHIRQKDTLWVYVFELFKMFFYFNPSVHLWFKHNLMLQELACDEALIKERGICSKDYAHCLLAAAEYAHSQKTSARELFTASIGFFHEKNFLTKRRISMLFDYKKSPTKHSLTIFFGFLISFLVATTAYAVGITASSHQENQALSNPILEDNYIIKWSNEAVLKTFTYNYKNYKESIESASHYFTADGWNAYMKALKASGNIDAVIAKKLTVVASSSNVPKIIKQGVENGRYTWHIEMPINVIYFNDKQKIKQTSIIDLLIVRTNETTNGIGIGELFIMPDKQ